MPDEFLNVTDPLSGAPSADAGTVANPIEEENQRLKSRLAQNEKMLSQAKPLVELTRKLWNAPGGREIVQKLQNNEPLSVEQNAQVTAAAAPSGITRDELRQELTALEQKQWEAQKADRAMKDLHEKASKELGEGYTNIAGTEQFNAMLNTVINGMQPTLDDKGEILAEPSIKTPEDEEPYYYAVKYAYGVLTGTSPHKSEKGESQPPKGGDKRRAAIAAQSSQPASGAAGETDENSDDPDLQWARSRGSATVGKSFASG